MVEIIEVPLDDIRIPDSKIGMVMMQPYLYLDRSTEPFKWKQSRKNQQIDHIKRTLELAKNPDHGCGKTSFTILPEYSIPGLEGIDQIESIIQDSTWANETIIIGGVDGLTQDEFYDLNRRENTHSKKPNDLPGNATGIWFNCYVTWVKDSNGRVSKWVQSKMSTAWGESSLNCTRMYRGEVLYLFHPKYENGITCRFFTLICFDWIGRGGMVLELRKNY